MVSTLVAPVDRDFGRYGLPLLPPRRRLHEKSLLDRRIESLDPSPLCDQVFTERPPGRTVPLLEGMNHPGLSGDSGAPWSS